MRDTLDRGESWPKQSDEREPKRNAESERRESERSNESQTSTHTHPHTRRHVAIVPTRAEKEIGGSEEVMNHNSEIRKQTPEDARS